MNEKEKANSKMLHVGHLPYPKNIYHPFVCFQKKKI
jgi:hypothetical protein